MPTPNQPHKPLPPPSGSNMDTFDIWRKLLVVVLCAFWIYALSRVLGSVRPGYAIFTWFLAPIGLFLMLVYYDRLFPLWVITIIFPLQVPVGGALIQINVLIGACIILLGLVRQTINEDVVTRKTFPWQLRVIILALMLAYVFNPAMPTAAIYAYDEIGTGFRRYITEGVQWAGIVYVIFYVRRLNDPERLMRYIRMVVWCAVIIKIAVLLSRNPVLYLLIGQDLDGLIQSGYLERFFFVTAAIAGGLQVTLCWRPANSLFRLLRYVLIVICFVALGAGGTRSDVLLGTVMIFSYLFLKKRFALMSIFAVVLMLQFSAFMYVPALREMLPQRYQRVFIYTQRSTDLTHIDHDIANIAMGTVQWRFEIIRLAARDIISSPIIGNGVRPAPILPYRQTPEDAYRRAINFVLTHNFYINQLLLLGIPAALLVFYWFASTFINGLKLIWANPGKNADSLLGFSVLSIPSVMIVGFINTMPTPEQAILIAIAIALVSRYKQPEANASKT